jgi:hypothetical protein
LEDPGEARRADCRGRGRGTGVDQLGPVGPRCRGRRSGSCAGSHLRGRDPRAGAGPGPQGHQDRLSLGCDNYAHLYYDQVEAGDAGGILFPEGGKPVFADFVYFAFVIGMTCQTADLDIASRQIRRVVTLQGLFAFFFNLGVLAMTMNVLSGVL